MRKPILIAVASLLALALTGCKGGDDTGSATTGGAIAPVTKGATGVTPETPKSGVQVGAAPNVGLNPNADPNKFNPGSKGGK